MTRRIDRLRAELPDKRIFATSGVSRQGVEKLLEVLWSILQEEKDLAKETTPVVDTPEPIAHEEDEPRA